MNKKAGIIGAVVVVIAIIVAVVIFNPFKNGDNKPAQDEIDNANDLQAYYPDKTQDEIIEMGREELTDEQSEIFDNIIGDFELPEVDEIISTPADQDLDSEKPTVVYKDKDGNTVVWEVEDEVWNATEEDLEESIDIQIEELRKMTQEYFNNDNNTPKVPTGNGNTVTKTDNGYVDEDNRPVDKNGNGLDIYNGFNTYEEYIADIQKQLPGVSIEQIKKDFPDQANCYVDEDLYNQDIKDDRLTGHN